MQVEVDTTQIVQMLMDAYLVGLSESEQATRISEFRPHLPPLNRSMNADLATRDDGRVMLVYDQPLPGYVWWAEYDRLNAEFCLVTLSGQVIDLGMKVHPDLAEDLMQATQIVLVEIAGDRVVDTAVRKMVVR